LWKLAPNQATEEGGGVTWREILAITIAAGLWSGLIGFLAAPHLRWRYQRRHPWRRPAPTMLPRRLP
jgi:hypothetical protein